MYQQRLDLNPLLNHESLSSFALISMYSHWLLDHKSKGHSLDLGDVRQILRIGQTSRLPHNMGHTLDLHKVLKFRLECLRFQLVCKTHRHFYLLNSQIEQWHIHRYDLEYLWNYPVLLILSY